MRRREPEAVPPLRRGQIASERARYEARTGNALDGRLADEPAAEPDAGPDEPHVNGLTYVRGWVRDPRHIVAAWDINDAEALRQGDQVGWDRACLRALDPRNRPLVHVLVGRRFGTHHLEVPAGRTLRLAVGIERPDGYFITLARSAPVRMPPGRPLPGGALEMLRIPHDLDLRLALRGERPARPGHHAAVRLSPAWRLLRRLHVAAEALPSSDVPDDLRRTLSEAPGSLPPATATIDLAVDDAALAELDAPTSPMGWGVPLPGVRGSGHWRNLVDNGSGGTDGGPPPVLPGGRPQ